MGHMRQANKSSNLFFFNLKNCNNLKFEENLQEQYKKVSCTLQPDSSISNILLIYFLCLFFPEHSRLGTTCFFISSTLIYIS
jgi:hypothetical protein